MIAWLAWAAIAVAGPPCPEDSVAQVEASVVAIDEAYEQFDEAAIGRAAKSLDAAVVCLERPAAPTTLAHIHQAMALSAFIAGRTRAAKASLTAARLVDPGWKLDDQLFLPDHPYRKLWEDATDPGPVEAIGNISPRTWVIDGYERAEAPTERAFLLQVRSEDGIEQTLYLWTFDDIPELGQNDAGIGYTPPRMVTVAIGAVGRFVKSEQVADVDDAWGSTDGSGVGGGMALSARLTANAFVGAEVNAAVSGPGDPVLGGGTNPELQAVALLGAGFPVGQQQLYASVRPGFAWDTIRVWPNGVADLRPTVYGIAAATAGIELGLRNDDCDLAITADYLLAKATVPYELRVDLDGSLRLADHLALQASPALRMGGIGFVDDRDTAIGRRNDLELRLTAGVALWY